MESGIDADFLKMSHSPDTDTTDSGTFAKKVHVLIKNEFEQTRRNSDAEMHIHVSNVKKKNKNHKYKSKNKKSTHLSCSETKKDQICDICNKTFSTRGSLKLHKIIHSGKGDLVCKTCGRAFRRYHHLCNHELTHQEKERSKHYICKTERLKTELKQDHVCDICNKTYSSKDSLRLHRKIHSGKRDFVCTTCGRAFRRCHHLRSHELSHQGEERSKQYICDTCGKSYVEKRALKDHMAVHSGVQEYFCDICGNGFWHKTGLRKHVYQVHLRKYTDESVAEKRKSRACRCEVCGKTVCSQDTLKRHMYIHTGEKEASCSICMKDFTTRHSLKRHMMRRHNPLKIKKMIFKSCSICNIDYGSKSGYNSHMLRNHCPQRVEKKKNKENKRCSICNKEFATRRHYTNHVWRQHNLLRVKNKNKSCSICNKEFTTSRGYANHVRQIHNTQGVKMKANNRLNKIGTGESTALGNMGKPNMHSENGKEDESEDLFQSMSKKGYMDIAAFDTFSGNAKHLYKTENTQIADNKTHTGEHHRPDYAVSKIKTDAEFSEEEEDTIPYCFSPKKVKTDTQEWETTLSLSHLLRNIADKSSASTSTEVENMKVDASRIKVAVSFGLDHSPSVQIKHEFDDNSPMGNDDHHLEPMESDFGSY